MYTNGIPMVIYSQLFLSSQRSLIAPNSSWFAAFITSYEHKSSLALNLVQNKVRNNLEKTSILNCSILSKFARTIAVLSFFSR